MVMITEEMMIKFITENAAEPKILTFCGFKMYGFHSMTFSFNLEPRLLEPDISMGAENLLKIEMGY